MFGSDIVMVSAQEGVCGISSEVQTIGMSQGQYLNNYFMLLTSVRACHNNILNL